TYAHGNLQFRIFPDPKRQASRERGLRPGGAAVTVPAQPGYGQITKFEIATTRAPAHDDRLMAIVRGHPDSLFSIGYGNARGDEIDRVRSHRLLSVVFHYDSGQY